MAVAQPDPASSVTRLKATARDLVALLTTATDEQLRRVPEGGEWSPATVLSHLADAELVFGVRLRMILTGDRPYLAAFDEGAWVRRFAEVDTDSKETMVRWRVLRDSNVRLFESLDEGEWKLSGLHAERGEMSVAAIAGTMAKHDSEHVDQLRAGLATDD
jgi:hypothetical protein